MAGTSLLTLIDDIASLLDDVAILTKVAAKKTAGVLGDDLALNAQQVSGVATNRELPVVWAVAKGSAKNKLVIVPLALAISALAPWAIVPLLMVGGAFLCFEGFEKVVHKFFHREQHEAQDEAHRQAQLAALVDPKIDVVALERDKIRGAIRTDVILSAEIIAITLGTVADEAFGKRLAVLTAVAVLMTVGVYGFVAGIVKLDDAGLALSQRKSGLPRAMGRAILFAAPFLMKALSLAGTVAMFLVGGGILSHGIAPLHHFSQHLQERMGGAGWIAPLLVDAVTGVVAGAVVLMAVQVGKRLWRSRRPAGH